MKVLVTGGAGYIGTELITQLVSNPEVEKVIIYDNLSRLNFNVFLGLRLQKHYKLQFVKGELLDTRALRKVLKGIDVVYHLAAKVATPSATTDAHVYEQVNHWGTAELVYAVEESDVRRFIYASSTGVYGSSREEVDETVPAEPQSLYATSKIRGEEHVRRLSDKIDTYIMRIGNVYGYSKTMRFDGVINRFVFDANFSKMISIQGDGKQARPFIHVETLSRALANLLGTQLPSGTYNLVQQSIKVIDLLDALKELVPGLEFLFINQHLRLHDLRVKPNAQVNQILGVSSAGDLKDELNEFISKFSF